MTHDVHIIGGGLAGSEAAWQLANRGAKVRLSEMRGGGGSTPAHQTDGLAELVCSNSFRSDDDENNAVGLLHHEMRRLDSLVMLVFEDRNGTSTNKNNINGNTSTVLNGTMYFPKSNVDFAGTATVTSQCLMIAAATINITGNANMRGCGASARRFRAWPRSSSRSRCRSCSARA